MHATLQRQKWQVLAYNKASVLVLLRSLACSQHVCGCVTPGLVFPCIVFCCHHVHISKFPMGKIHEAGEYLSACIIQCLSWAEGHFSSWEAMASLLKRDFIAPISCYWYGICDEKQILLCIDILWLYILTKLYLFIQYPVSWIHAYIA